MIAIYSQFITLNSCTKKWKGQKDHAYLSLPVWVSTCHKYHVFGLDGSLWGWRWFICGSAIYAGLMVLAGSLAAPQLMRWLLLNKSQPTEIVHSVISITDTAVLSLSFNPISDTLSTRTFNFQLLCKTKTENCWLFLASWTLILQETWKEVGQIEPDNTRFCLLLWTK